MKSFAHLESYLDYQKRVFHKIGANHFRDRYILDLGCGFKESTVLIAKFAKKQLV